jgi:hypothetical protein
MNEAPADVSEESEQPQNDENKRYSPKHDYLWFENAAGHRTFVWEIASRRATPTVKQPIACSGDRMSMTA